MQKRWTPVLLASAIWGLTPGAHAADKPLSYAADNQCFCNLAVSNPLANRMVGTPIGGQSVEQVCQRIGAGPKLIESDSGYNFPVYQDAQCGHGPRLSSQLSDTDKSTVGPKWNLASAYGAPVKKMPAPADVAESDAVADADADADADVDTKSHNTPTNRFKPRYVNLPSGADNTVQPSQTTSTAIRLKPSIKKPVAVTPIKDAPSTASTKSESSIQKSTVSKVESVAGAKEDPPQPKVKPVTQAVNETKTETKAKLKPALKAAKVTTPEAPKSATLADLDTVSNTSPKKLEVLKTKPVAKVTEEEIIRPLPDETRTVVVTPIAETSEIPELAQKQPVLESPVRLPIPTSVEAAEEVFSHNAANAAVVEEVAKAPQPLPTAPSTAIQAPGSVDAALANPEFLSVIPMTYDFGGSGIRFTASALRTKSLGLTLKASVAESYQEGSAGVNYLLNAGRTNRLALSLAGGVEYGRFKLAGRGVETTVADLGVFASASALFAVTPRLHVQGGLGISSFFDGDPHVLGSAFYSLTPQWDIAGEFELGDNDSVGLGVRYYY